MVANAVVTLRQQAVGWPSEACERKDACHKQVHQNGEQELVQFTEAGWVAYGKHFVQLNALENEKNRK